MKAEERKLINVYYVINPILKENMEHGVTKKGII